MSQPKEKVHQGRRLPLMIGAIGVVFGDIGTSPLYTVKEALGGSNASMVSSDSVLGVISLIIWTLLVVLTLKYQFFIMRASDQGEGGNLVLVELARRLTNNPTMHRTIMVIGMIGVSFFFGDGVITPAISVLSAVEGLDVATPAFKDFIIPITLFILFLLFFFQSRGTDKIGRLFGPICLIWFVSIALLGLKEIFKHSEILYALNPVYGIRFLFGGCAGNTFAVLGSIFLAVTGAEALYADMGHFGKSAINWSWGGVVFPALILNYLGQGALILGTPEAVKNPFFLCVPEWALLPMVGLATAATVTASQAVISGAFSATQQAIQLGYLPRMRVVHTSSTEFGQIYVPTTNWMLLIAVVILVISFKSSSNLASAYGIAVTITMVVATVLSFGIVLRKMLSWSWPKAVMLIVPFLVVDLGFFGANILKVAEGGWFSLVLGGLLFFIMSTWRKGQDLVWQTVKKKEIPLEPFLHQFEANPISWMPGTAIFLTKNVNVAPSAFVELLRDTMGMHENVIFLNVQHEVVPYVKEGDRVKVEVLFDRYYCVKLCYGFMENMDVPKALSSIRLGGGDTLDFEDITIFNGKTMIQAGNHPEMAPWRMKFFLEMYRNAESATDFFNLSHLHVVDLGTHIVLEGH